MPQRPTPSHDSQTAPTPPAVSGETAVPSLPPAPGDARLTPPASKPKYKLAKKSVIKAKALAVIALRAQGWSDQEIADELKIAKNSIHTYLWWARKNGSLVGRNGESMLAGTDKVEFEIIPQVIENIQDALTHDRVLSKGEKSLKHEMTLEVAKGVLFKKFDPAREVAAPAMTVLAVKVEMPTAGANIERPGSLGGQPHYIEGEVEGER